jgi:RNA polymerase sigma-32 factor
MNAPIALPIAASGGSLEAYVRQVNAIPMLSAAEERALSDRFRRHDDLEAARRLVMAHLRFVVRVASGYRGYGLPFADLIQEGNIGLMKAVKRFDPEVGVRLVSFAVHWIRAEIHEFIIRNWRIVKVATTKAQRKLFFNLRGAKKRLGWLNPQEVAAVAEDLGVSADDVLEMEARLNAVDASYDAQETVEGETEFAPAGYLEDLRWDPARTVAEAEAASRELACLESGLEHLDERARAIIEARWLSEPKATLQELAERFGVSAERIRQLEKAALKNLRRGMNSLDPVEFVSAPA